MRDLRRALVTAGVALAGLGLAILLTPAVVNGDGLGYLKAAPTGIVVAGHLGYLPLVRALGHLLGRTQPLELLVCTRAISWVSLALGAAALFAAARRVLDEGAAIACALGLAASFGALQAGSDIETYAPALAALCLTTWCALVRRDGGGVLWLAATAIGVAAAALLHIENVLFAPAAALLAASRSDGDRRAASAIVTRAAVAPGWRLQWSALHLRDAIAVLLGSGLPVLGAYAVAAHARGDTVAGAVRWVAGASHGFSYPLRWSTPIVALYGMAKTLVYAPYPHQAPWSHVVGQTLAGVLGLTVLLWLARRPTRPRTLGTLVAVAWLMPYAVVGVAFFASDNERWMFLLPPAWLAAAAGMASSLRARRVGQWLVAGLVAADLCFGLPLGRESDIRTRADALGGLVSPHDLVISPGHSWDEYLGFYDGKTLDRFPMIYFCGLLGGADAMKQELAHRVADARARGSRIWVARFDEDITSDGWKELVRFGVTPQIARSFVPAGTLVPVAPGLLRLDR